MIFLSVQSLYDYEKWSPFEGAQVAAAKQVVQRAGFEDTAVLAPYNEVILLLFADVPGTVTDRRVINDIVTASSSEELASRLNALGANEGKILFFISKRFARDGVRVNPNALGGSSGPFTILTLLRQNNPNGVSLGARTLSTSSAPIPVLDVVELDLGAAYLYEISTK